MRSFKYSITNAVPYQGLDGTIIFGDGTDPTYHILLQSADGLDMPSIDTQTQTAPFQQGASLIRTRHQPRLITLNCAINVFGNKAAAVATRTAIKRALGTVGSTVGAGFQPQSSLSSSTYGTVLGQLAYASDGSSYDRFIDCVPIGLKLPNKLFNGWQMLQVVFFCPDPFWYDSPTTVSMTACAVSPVPYYSAGILWVPSHKRGYFSKYQTTDLINFSLFNVPFNNPVVLAHSPSLGSAQWGRMIACEITGMYYSDDGGVTWTTATGGPTYPGCVGARIESIGKFVVCNSNYVYTSADGTSWAQQSLAAFANQGITGIAWSEPLKRVVICGPNNSSGSVAYSSDGTNWTVGTMPVPDAVRQVLWSDTAGLWVMVGGNYTFSSPDGITWSYQTAVNITALAYNSVTGLFWGYRSNVSWMYTSKDGLNWTVVTSNAGSYSLSNWMQYIPSLGLFQALGAVNSNAAIVYSTDGANWFSIAATDYQLVINTQGSGPSDFSAVVPVAGNETGKLLVFSDNFPWGGAGGAPTDHVISISTAGCKPGTVVINTKFGQKSLTQYGRSIMKNFQQGQFFSLYLGANTLYFRNTGTAAGAPSITYRNKYLSV